MHAEEVVLGHVHLRVVNVDVHGHRRDEAQELAVLGVAHTHMPLLQETRRGECPLKEGNRVVKAITAAILS